MERGDENRINEAILDEQIEEDKEHQAPPCPAVFRTHGVDKCLDKDRAVCLLEQGHICLEYLDYLQKYNDEKENYDNSTN